MSEDYGTNSSQYNPTSGMASYSGKTESSDLLGGENGYRPSGLEWANVYKDLSDRQQRYWEQKAREGEPGAMWQAGASANIAKNYGGIASNPAQAEGIRWARGGFQPLIDRLQQEGMDVSPDMARYLQKNKEGAKPLPTGNIGGGNGTLTQQSSLFGGDWGYNAPGAAPNTTPQTSSFNHNSGWAGSGSPWTDAAMGRGSGTPFKNSSVGQDPGRGIVDWNVGPMPGQVPVDTQRLLEQHQNAILGMPSGGIAQQQGSAFQAKAPQPQEQYGPFDTSGLVAQTPQMDVMGPGGMATSRYPAGMQALEPKMDTRQAAVPQPQMRNTEIQDPEVQAMNPQNDSELMAMEGQYTRKADGSIDWRAMSKNTPDWQAAPKGAGAKQDAKKRYADFQKQMQQIESDPNVLQQVQQLGGPLNTKERRVLDVERAKTSGYNQGSGLDINPQTGQPFSVRQFDPQGDLSVVGMQPVGGGRYEVQGPEPVLSARSPQEQRQIEQRMRAGNHPNTPDYNMAGYLINNPDVGPRKGNTHYPDTYKRRNHETFSNQSIYSHPGETRNWKGDQYYNGEQFLKNEGAPMRKDPLRYGTPFDDELYTNAQTKMYQKGSSPVLKGSAKGGEMSTPFDDELYDRSGQKKFVKGADESLLRSNPPGSSMQAGRGEFPEMDKHAKLKAYARSNPKIMAYLHSLA